jgi:hypothetical protein
MTKEELTTWMQHPETLGEKQGSELREMCDVYPYFSITRMLWLKSLQNTHDVRFERETRRTATYCVDRRKLYYLLFPEKKIIQTEYLQTHQPPLYNAFGGDYFTLQSYDSSNHPEESLKSLALKLRETRQKAKASIKQDEIVSNSSSPETSNLMTHTNETTIYSEEMAIALIKQKHYEEALKILHAIRLNIPEKSVYFADQIRFLEKIIATIHKS